MSRIVFPFGFSPLSSRAPGRPLPAAVPQAALAAFDAEAELLRRMPADLLQASVTPRPRWHQTYAPAAPRAPQAGFLQAAHTRYLAYNGPAWLEELRSVCHRNDFAITVFATIAFAVGSKKLGEGRGLSWPLVLAGAYLGAALWARKAGDTNSEQAYMALGRCRLAEGDVAGAEAAFFRAPAYCDGLLGLVEARRRQGKWDAAATALARLQVLCELPDELEVDVAAQASLLAQSCTQPLWMVTNELRR